MIRCLVQNDVVCTVDSVVYFGVLSLPHSCLLAIACARPPFLFGLMYKMVLVVFITVHRFVAGLALDDWTVGGYGFGAPDCRGHYLLSRGCIGGCQRAH